jgi:nucleoid-associated protein YgaU
VAPNRWADAQLRHGVTSREPEEATADQLLDAAVELGIRDFTVRSELGRRVISGVARCALDRERFFEVLKRIDGWERDYVLNISVERDDIRGFHTVQRGETLASIAMRYLGGASRELDIFAANRDRMNDPDQVFPGQQLLIPWR